MLPSAAGVRSAILSSARLTGMALTDRHIIPGENPHAAHEGQGNFCFPCVLVRDDFHFGQAAVGDYQTDSAIGDIREGTLGHLGAGRFRPGFVRGGQARLAVDPPCPYY